MCDVGAGSPLQSLVTLVSWQQAQPTNPTIIREEQTSNSRQEKTNKHNKRPNKKGATNDTPKNTQAAKRAEKAKERTGTRGKTAGGGQQQQDKQGGPGGGSKDRRKQHRPRKGRMQL